MSTATDMPVSARSNATERTPVATPLSIRDITEVLIKHHGLHEGRYELLVEFKLGLGSVGPSPDELLPGALLGLYRLGLLPTEAVNKSTVDAAEVNPAKKNKKKS